MSKKKNNKKDKMIRCACSGRIVRPNQEVVLVENLVTYARKLGYFISKKPIFLFLVMSLLLLTSLSALEFDNVKTYDDKTNTLKVENAFSLGDTILEFQRTTPNPNPVIRSGSTAKKDWRAVVCYKNLDLDYDFSKEEIFTGQEFYDLKAGSVGDNTRIYRDYEWRVAYPSAYQEPVFKRTCFGDFINPDGTFNDDCSYEIDYYITKYKTGYKAINSLSELNIGDEFCLFTYVGAEEHGEQIPSFAGLRFSEDSEWNETLTIGLVAYWNGDESSGVAVQDNYLGLHNGTASNARVIGNAGKLNNELDLGEPDTINVSDSALFENADMSFSLWYKADSYVNNAGMFAHEQGGAVWTSWSIFSYSGGIAYRGGGSSDALTHATSDTSAYHLVVVTQSGTTARMFFDGVQVTNDTSFTAIGSNADQLVFGYAFGNAYDGALDEVGIWNRTLTHNEVTQLYNGGTGISFSAEGGCSVSYVNTSWSAWSNISCVGDNMNQSQFLIQYDENDCGEYENETFYNYTLAGPIYQNTSLTAWTNISCLTNDTMNQSRYKIQYDDFACASNTTFYEYQQSEACNYCSFNLVNYTSIDWINVTACLSDYYTENKTIIEYDSNNLTCYAVTLIEGDAFNSGANLTIELTRETFCGNYSDPELFEIEFNNFTAMIFFVLFLISAGLFIMRLYVFSGALVGLIGFCLLFSSFNSVVSFVVIIGGVLILFVGK